MRITALMIVLGALGCGATTAPAETVTIAAPEPSASSAPSATVVATADATCELGATMRAPTRSARISTTAGQMTEEAARAKRLFDSERWEEAFTALSRVAGGATGDDQGNKELAQYHAAIALYRAKHHFASAVLFRVIAHNRDHLKNAETLLWLSKLAIDHAELVDFADFAPYTEEDVSRFNNPNQHDLFEALSYLVGRAYLRTREFETAARLFAQVPEGSTFGPRARACRGLLHD